MVFDWISVLIVRVVLEHPTTQEYVEYFSARVGSQISREAKLEQTSQMSVSSPECANASKPETHCD